MAGPPADDLTEIERYCSTRVTKELLPMLRIEATVRGRSVTIWECRPPWDDPRGPEWTRIPVAQLRFTNATGLWSLYWTDSNSRWHPFDLIRPGSVRKLLAEIEADRTNIFWG